MGGFIQHTCYEHAPLVMYSYSIACGDPCKFTFIHVIVKQWVCSTDFFRVCFYWLFRTVPMDAFFQGRIFVAVETGGTVPFGVPRHAKFGVLRHPFDSVSGRQIWRSRDAKWNGSTRFYCHKDASLEERVHWNGSKKPVETHPVFDRKCCISRNALGQKVNIFALRLPSLATLLLGLYNIFLQRIMQLFYSITYRPILIWKMLFVLLFMAMFGGTRLSRILEIRTRPNASLMMPHDGAKE